MNDIIHTSRVKIVREKDSVRRAVIVGFSEPIYYGVHGGIKKFYKIEPLREFAATLDHIIAATAGWMMGTLATYLVSNGISTAEDNYWAEAEGDIENVNGVLKITTIRVKYHLKLTEGKISDAKECLSKYIKRCPAAQSVIGCIKINDELVIEK
jgi:hypothetical protein